MKITNIPVNKIKPYEKNAKQHPEDQIERIANSIAQFGFQQPLVVDKNNVLIIGHGRLLAAKYLHLTEVPCVKAEELDKEQVKALRLADNKVAESDWDMDLLKDELNDIFDIDMSDFGFDLDLDDSEIFDVGKDEKEDDRDPSCQHNVFENQDTMQFPCVGKYGFPEMQPTQTTGEQMLRFMDWKEVDNPQDYIAHFYYDDYKFISAWREPDKYLDRLKQFKAVISPDFSLYTDFPRALQILSAPIPKARPTLTAARASET